MQGGIKKILLCPAGPVKTGPASCFNITQLLPLNFIVLLEPISNTRFFVQARHEPFEKRSLHDSK